MFNFDSTTINNTNFFEQSIPINQNRKENNFLSNNTTTRSFSSTNLFGTTTSLQPSSLQTSNIFSKHESIIGLDKIINKNNIQILNKNHTDNDKNNQKVSSSKSNSFLFDNKSHTITAKTFSFDITQSSTASSSTFPLGNVSSSFPTTTTTTNTPFNFSLSKSATTSSSIITTVPTLFSTMNQSTTSPVDLQLFQTMINTQPFNNELAFVERNIKPHVNLDRARIRHSSINRSKSNLFPSILTKPSVLSTTHINTLSSSKSNKRKLVDSFLDDDDDPTFINKISKINIKRPRMLDMNKIRSIILGNNKSTNDTLSEYSIDWKNFSTYDEYISSKKQDTKYNQRSFCLPKLTHKDYYTKPTIEELNSYFNEQGQCFVKQFTIGRKHYGSVTFQGLHMNLAGLDLDRLVEIDHRQVTVYPDDKDRPNEGEELNCQAIISLLGIYPIDRSISNSGEEITDPERLIKMNYDKYLEEMTKKFHGQFLDYDVYTGTWRFQVEHF